MTPRLVRHRVNPDRLIPFLCIGLLTAARLGYAQPARVATAGYCHSTAVSGGRGGLERSAFRCAKGAVSRRDSTLAVHLLSGATIRYTDSADGDMVSRYAYYGLLRGPDPTVPAFHVLSVGHYEGSEMYLVNAATGDSVRIANLPVVSPDRRRFAVADVFDCEEGGPTHYATLEVWRLASPVPEREFVSSPSTCRAPGGWLPGKLTWRSNEQIAIRVRAGKSTRTKLLSRREGRWSMP